MYYWLKRVWERASNPKLNDVCAIIVLLLLLLLYHLRLSLFLENVDTVIERFTAYPKFHSQRLVSNYFM